MFQADLSQQPRTPPCQQIYVLNTSIALALYIWFTPNAFTSVSLTHAIQHSANFSHCCITNNMFRSFVVCIPIGLILLLCCLMILMFCSPFFLLTTMTFGLCLCAQPVCLDVKKFFLRTNPQLPESLIQYIAVCQNPTSCKHNA